MRLLALGRERSKKMLDQPKELIEKHIKTHTERSAEDEAAVSTLDICI